MLLFGTKKLMDSEGIGCGLGCIIVLVIFAISIAIKGAIVFFAWNFLVVDVLELTSHTLSFGEAALVGFIISLVTG